MKDVFLRILVISLTCSALLAPLLIFSRSLRGRYAAKTLYFLWLLLALRMALPLPLSVSKAPVTVELPSYDVTIPAMPPSAPKAPTFPWNPSASAVDTPSEEVSVTVTQSVELSELAAAVWAAGAGLFLLWQVAAYFKARWSILRESVPATDEEWALLGRLCSDLGVGKAMNLCRSAKVASPMLLGLMSPMVVLPDWESDPDDLEAVLRHELCHLKRGDVAYKSFFLLVNVLHWFNPLVWLMAREAARNVEFCCDDEVLRGADGPTRKHYGEVLLDTAAGSIYPAFSTHFGSGKKQLRERLLNLFQPKKNSVILVCAVAVVALLAGSAVAFESGRSYLPGTAPNVVEMPVPTETSTPVPSAWPGNVDLAQGIDRTDLESCIWGSVINYGRNTGGHNKETLMTGAHVTLKTEEKGNEVTAYVMMCYNSFTVVDGALSDSMGNGGSFPAAITYSKATDGTYTEKEFWVPQDGSGYISSILERFPDGMTAEEVSTQKYILAELQSCYAQGVAYFGIDTDAVAAELLENIISSPATSSNPGDYHTLDYRELTFYGDYAKDYCFRQFEKGGQTDLRGSIMAALCRELLGSAADVESKDGTGQGWYDAYMGKLEVTTRSIGTPVPVPTVTPGTAITLPVEGEAPVVVPKLPTETDTPIRIQPITGAKSVIDLKSGGQGGITKSASFAAEEGQKLTITATSNIAGGTVDLFLFSPDGKQERVTIGGEDVTKEITLTAGTWAYNCTGFFESGEVSIIGTVG